ncbi:hypothetical protein L8106_14760 [Lyngbya sp. PCC 8106]|nr:hypothetical protein L8106_14760 [Lyngbya sp. PCC 8106]
MVAQADVKNPRFARIDGGKVIEHDHLLNHG